MLYNFMTWLQFALVAFQDNIRWMSWNLYLALIPLGLSIWLFQQSRSRSWLWWAGLLAFIAFLPNAPYVLTDTIHLVDDLRKQPSLWISTLVIIPQYTVFLLIGFGAYVLSLLNLGEYFKRQGWNRWVFWAELSIHGLSAIGVYLGRFLRFNSWDIITRPQSLSDAILNDLLAHRPLFLMGATALIIAGLYGLSKQVVLALIVYHRVTRLGGSRTPFS